MSIKFVKYLEVTAHWQNVLALVYYKSLRHTSVCLECPKRSWNSLRSGGVQQLLNSANNEFLLGFCMLMNERDLVPKWLVNMHHF